MSIRFNLNLNFSLIYMILLLLKVLFLKYTTKIIYNNIKIYKTFKII